jgi:hypothetical protein
MMRSVCYPPADLHGCGNRGVREIGLRSAPKLGGAQEGLSFQGGPHVLPGRLARGAIRGRYLVGMA